MTALEDATQRPLKPVAGLLGHLSREAVLGLICAADDLRALPTRTRGLLLSSCAHTLNAPETPKTANEFRARPRSARKASSRFMANRESMRADPPSVMP